jgi:hypothetical protein
VHLLTQSLASFKQCRYDWRLAERYPAMCVLLMHVPTASFGEWTCDMAHMGKASLSLNLDQSKSFGPFHIPINCSMVFPLNHPTHANITVGRPHRIGLGLPGHCAEAMQNIQDPVLLIGSFFLRHVFSNLIMVSSYQLAKFLKDFL